MITKILNIVLISIVISSAAYAGTVYKWNEDGKTIYSQTPPPKGVEYEVVVEKDVGKSTTVATAESSSESLDKRREERIQNRNEKKVQEESDKIKKENCNIAQNNMKSLTSHGQVTVKEGDIYRKLTEEERQTRVEETQAQLEEYCQG